MIFGNSNITPSIYREETLSLRGVITQKKFSGLISEFSSNPSCNYICVLDSESIASQNTCLLTEFQSLYSSQTFKANYSVKGGEIIQRICKALGDQIDYDYLREVTHDFQLYWWMNDACIYERNDFLEFYSWLLLLPSYKQIINDYWCFDYLIYSVYLINYKSFKLIVPLDESFSFEFAAVESGSSPLVAKSFGSLVDCVHDHNLVTRAIFKIHIDTFPSSSLPTSSIYIRFWRIVFYYVNKTSFLQSK